MRVLAALPADSLVADVPDFGGGPSWGQARELSAAVRGGDWFHPSDAGYRLYRDAFRDASDVL